jgi:uncharacterized protein YacL
MMRIKGQNRITLTTFLIGVVGGVVGYLLQILYTALVIPFVQKILPAMAQETLLAIGIILFLLLVISMIALYIFWKKSKTFIDVFEYSRDPGTGVSQHKATGEYFCTSCLINRIVSPVREDETSWYCMRKGCEQKYPKYKTSKVAAKIK